MKHRKYARWKATYIHNCLKNGETPQAGPVGIEEDNGMYLVILSRNVLAESCVFRRRQSFQKVLTIFSSTIIIKPGT